MDDLLTAQNMEEGNEATSEQKLSVWKTEFPKGLRIRRESSWMPKANAFSEELSSSPLSKSWAKALLLMKLFCYEPLEFFLQKAK